MRMVEVAGLLGDAQTMAERTTEYLCSGRKPPWEALAAAQLGWQHAGRTAGRPRPGVLSPREGNEQGSE